MDGRWYRCDPQRHDAKQAENRFHVREAFPSPVIPAIKIGPHHCVEPGRSERGYAAGPTSRQPTTEAYS
jgi:hypothetical protein